MTNLHKNLAYNLKRLRQLESISQDALAAKTNLSSGYIGDLETGAKFPSPSKLEILAKVLGVKPYMLIMSKEDMDEDSSAELREVAYRFKIETDKSYQNFVKQFNASWPDRGPFD